jgi:transposase-like protein
MIKQPTIRINRADKMKVDRICRETDMSQPALLHRAVELLEREQLANQLQAEFEALASDAKALKAYRNESQMLDQASSDQLGQ